MTVKKRTTRDSFWVTYKGDVYDMTSFINGHPGGKSRLLMAGGNDLQPFWDIYPDHLRGHVVPWLKQFKIGELTPEDATEIKNWTFYDSYADVCLRFYPVTIPCFPCF